MKCKIDKYMALPMCGASIHFVYINVCFMVELMCVCTYLGHAMYPFDFDFLGGLCNAYFMSTKPLMFVVGNGYQTKIGASTLEL